MNLRLNLSFFSRVCFLDLLVSESACQEAQAAMFPSAVWGVISPCRRREGSWRESTLNFCVYVMQYCDSVLVGKQDAVFRTLLRQRQEVQRTPTQLSSALCVWVPGAQQILLEWLLPGTCWCRAFPLPHEGGASPGSSWRLARLGGCSNSGSTDLKRSKCKVTLRPALRLLLFNLSFPCLFVCFVLNFHLADMGRDFP